jgi:hypothetical protein
MKEILEVIFGVIVVGILIAGTIIAFATASELNLVALSWM